MHRKRAELFQDLQNFFTWELEGHKFSIIQYPLLFNNFLITLTVAFYLLIKIHAVQIMPISNRENSPILLLLCVHTYYLLSSRQIFPVLDPRWTEHRNKIDCLQFQRILSIASDLFSTLLIIVVLYHNRLSYSYFPLYSIYFHRENSLLNLLLYYIILFQRKDSRKNHLFFSFILIIKCRISSKLFPINPR